MSVDAVKTTPDDYARGTATEPLVTIAIPTYNRADSFLPVVLDAALAQTWQRLEILVGNNASTDGTEALLASYDDPRIRTLNHERNLGANGNFNSLLEAARGDWFLLFHDDDLIDPDFVATCMGALEEGRDYGFIRTGVRAINHKGEVVKEVPNRMLGPTPADFFRSWFRARTGLYLCNTLYRTAYLREVGGWHSLHNLLEDNYALVKLLGRWDHGEVEAIKASYRYTYDQRTYQVPVVEWCQDFRQLLDMIVEVVSPAERDAIRAEGRRFFGQLCVRRANALASPVKRLLARLQVARYFGWRSLRLAWQLPA
jgi:glycosyltransferase involved in cell wall biosynthesis